MKPLVFGGLSGEIGGLLGIPLQCRKRFFRLSRPCKPLLRWGPRGSPAAAHWKQKWERKKTRSVRRDDSGGYNGGADGGVHSVAGEGARACLSICTFPKKALITANPFKSRCGEGEGLKSKDGVHDGGCCKEVATFQDLLQIHQQCTSQSIKSFSLLAKYSMERYETGEFESGGYKWKLVIYPNGNKDKNVTEHISLYLAIEAADLRPPGWEVHAIFRFFLYDQIRDNYLTIEDTKKRERCFRGKKLEWGYDKVIPLKTFKDASDGYLVDDTCVFGAEVFVSKQRSMDKGECLELIKESITNKFVFRIENYSKLTADDYDSNSFNVGNYKWKIWLSPNGKGIGMGSYNSLNLALANKSNLSAVSRWFSASDYVHGWDRFISIGSSNLTNMGLLVKDTFVVEAEVTILAVVIQHPEFVVQNYQM
ncbi:hypothetical protein CMV_010280 [Castanea mollissima]|uniref:MATH domain-containing protein n=1 Tax=Castanea mollissima TaxID=60419 RepID=A0A8J4R7Q3_9ROSI|nr:hypothetical protein CMV_010280 [Castanea mollissima]